MRELDLRVPARFKSPNQQIDCSDTRCLPDESFIPNSQGPADAYVIVPNNIFNEENDIKIDVTSLCNRAVNVLGLPKKNIRDAIRASANCQKGGILPTEGVTVENDTIIVDRDLNNGYQRVIAVDFGLQTADLKGVATIPTPPPKQDSQPNLPPIIIGAVSTALGITVATNLILRRVNRLLRARQEAQKTKMKIREIQKKKAHELMRQAMAKPQPTAPSRPTTPPIIIGENTVVTNPDEVIRAKGAKRAKILVSPSRQTRNPREVRSAVQESGKGFTQPQSVEEKVEKLAEKHQPRKWPSFRERLEPFNLASKRAHQYFKAQAEEAEGGKGIGEELPPFLPKRKAKS